MFEVSYSDSSIVFINTRTKKSEALELLDAMPVGDAIKAITTEQRAAVSASRAAVSLFASMLDTPRLDGYKGQTPIRESVPKELKAAVRELEVETLRPQFIAYHTEKGAKPATAEKQWQEFAEGLRAGGSYAVAKGKVLAYFAHCGKLPKADNGKLLSVAAIEKLLANAKEAAGKDPDEGISGKLVKLALELENRTEGTKLGTPATAISALRAMLATYEQLEAADREAAMRAQEVKTAGDVSKQAAEAIKAAANKPNPQAEPATKGKGQRIRGKKTKDEQATA